LSLCVNAPVKIALKNGTPGGNQEHGMSNENSGVVGHYIVRTNRKWQYYLVLLATPVLLSNSIDCGPICLEAIRE
jgi:hypothetical protein